MRSLLLVLGTATLIACSPITKPNRGEAIDAGPQGNDDAGVSCTDSNECGCFFNEECASGACDFETGSCEMPNNIVYVDANDGTDNSGCTLAIPCRTLVEATSQLDANRDTLVMAPGNYNERLLLPATFDVRVIGNGATIDGSGLTLTTGEGLVQTAPQTNVLIESLEVIGSPAIGILCQGDSSGGGLPSTLNLDEVKVLRSSAGGIAQQNNCDGFFTGISVSGSDQNPSGAAGISWKNGELYIDSSHVFDNRGPGIFANDILFSIQNSLLTGNGSGNNTPAIEVSGTTTGQPVVIRYNTIAFNETGCYGAVRYQDTPQSVVFDSNIVYFNFENDNCSAGDQSVVSNTSPPTNNIIEIVPGATQGLPGSNNSSDDPLFANSRDGDYSLGEFSLGIDTGTPEESPSDDFFGTSRPLGPRPDIGAIESF